jgi:hypothetical protein
MKCPQCERLEREVASLTRYIRNHQESGLRWLQECRRLRKELERLRRENETLRTGRVPKKSKKRLPIGSGTK